MMITLVRHGEVEKAYQHCYNGHNDIGLSKRGRNEAEKLALFFKEIEFNAVYCSDLKRCRETLAPIIQHSTFNIYCAPQIGFFQRNQLLFPYQLHSLLIKSYIFFSYFFQ